MHDATAEGDCQVISTMHNDNEKCPNEIKQSKHQQLKLLQKIWFDSICLGHPFQSKSTKDQYVEDCPTKAYHSKERHVCHQGFFLKWAQTRKYPKGNGSVQITEENEGEITNK